MIALMVAAALAMQDAQTHGRTDAPTHGRTAAQDTTRLTVHEAVARALGQYPTVAASRAQRDRAAAVVREDRSQLLPRLALDAGATQAQLPGLVYPLHSLPTGPASPLPVFATTLFQASAVLNWTLYDFGARKNRVEASRSLEGAAEAALTSAQQQLVARAANAYLRVLTARQTLAAQDQRLAALGAESERTRRLLAEGKAARVTLLRADAALARARADRSGTAGELDVAEHDLAQLTALPWEGISRDTLPEAALADTTDPAPLVTGAARVALVARAQEASADLLEVRRRAAAAQAGANALRRARMPELRLSAGLVDRGAPDNTMKAEWQAGLGISYPLYTGGARSGAIDRGDADARGARAQLRLAELGTTAAVDRAVAAVIQSHARVLALQSAVEQSDAVVQVERTALEVGSGTQTDYLDALALALQARSSLIEARHAEIAARIELARITGELSPEWLVRHLEAGR
jgi:outer membrane protein